MEEQLICPYPGLRPFNEDEAIFFKGREEHIEQIVKQLEEKKFLMLTGASGDGKSSLVYAGVIPNARAGFFKAKFNNWVVADFRPEREPLKNMAAAICTQLQITGVLGVEKELSYGFSALIDIYKASPYWVNQKSEAFLNLSVDEQKKAKRKGANLLILVDQFEEFFTNPENYVAGKTSLESQAVVNSLLETTRLAIEQDIPIYIVCTMRSDYIGQCASFRGLPEYIGYSQFFVPRLKRKEIYQVIEEPALLNGNKISKRLVEMLINEMNDGIDQLPVLQHALNQIWQKANRGQVEMDLIHFAKINGIPKNQLTATDKAEFETWFNALPDFKKEFFTHSSLGDVLDAHANELFEIADETTGNSVSKEDSKLIVETAFKCLTKIDEARAVRNRMTLEEVTQIINQPHITNAQVEKVLYNFRVQGNTFLKPFIFDVADESDLSSNSVLDITHESLIRNWKKLTEWAKDEYDNLLTWQDFNKQLQRWTTNKKSSGYLLPIGSLTFFENWFNIAQPNKYWLARYDEREISKEQKLEDAELTLTNAKQFIKRSARRLFVNRTVIKYGADKIIAVFFIALFAIGCTYFFFDFRKKQNDYVIKDIQEKSKDLLKSKYIKNKVKADYILAAERLNPGVYKELINLVGNDSVKNVIEREMLVECFSIGKNDWVNESENILLEPLIANQINYLENKKIFDNNKKFIDNINIINLIVYSDIILRNGKYVLTKQKLSKKYTNFCDKSFNSFINLLADTAALRKTDINQFNKLIQIMPDIVEYDGYKIEKIINVLSPFSSTNVFKTIYPIEKTVKSGYNEKLTHNGGYFQLANLYALTGNFNGLNRSFDSLIVFNKNFVNSNYGYSNSRLLYSLMISNKLCTEEGGSFFEKIEKLKTTKSNFSLAQLFIETILNNNGRHVLSYSLENIFDASSDPSDFNSTFDRISSAERIQFIDYSISQCLKNSKLGSDNKNFEVSMLYKSKAFCYNLTNDVNYSQIDTALGKAFEFYGKISNDFLNEDISIGERSESKLIKKYDLFKYPGRIEISNIWNTYNLWNVGHDKSIIINYITKNKVIFDKYYKTDKDVLILDNFIIHYAEWVFEEMKFNKRLNLDFIENLLSDKNLSKKLNKDYAHCALTIFYDQKKEYKLSQEHSFIINTVKLFNKEDLKGDDSWNYIILAYRLSAYYSTTQYYAKNISRKNDLVNSTIKNLPLEYLKRNSLLVTIDSLQKMKGYSMAIALTDTLLNNYINRTQRYGNKLFQILGRFATKSSNNIAMTLLKDKSDKIKPTCLNLFIRGLLESNRYYEATTFIPDYVSSSSQLLLYTTFINNEVYKNRKSYTGWGNLDIVDGWNDGVLERGEDRGNVYYSQSDD